MMLVRPRRPAPGAASTAAPAPSDPVLDAAVDSMPLWLRAALGALAAAAASTALVCLPIVLTWLTSAYASGSGSQAVQLGLVGWLGAHGVPIRTAGGTVSMVPWGLTLLPLATLGWTGRWVVAALPDGRVPRLVSAAGLRRDVALSGLAFAGGYGLTGLLVAVVSGPVGFAGHPLAAALYPAALAVLAFVVALRREFRDDLPQVAPGVAVWWSQAVPLWVRRAVRPAVRGMLTLWVAGLVLVVVAVGLRLGRVIDLQGELGAGFFGGVVLVLAQLLYLPTAAVWADSWLAGPGFALGNPSSVTWSFSDPGLMPLIPLFGAIPDRGPLPGWTWLVVLVPVGVGALVGRGALGTLTRLASWRAKATTMAIAVALAGSGMSLLGLLASGSLGAGRLADVGVHPLAFGLCVTGEMLAGGCVAVAVAELGARRARP